MGVALAECANEMGANVNLVLGPTIVKPQSDNIKVTNVTSANSLWLRLVYHFFPIAI